MTWHTVVLRPDQPVKQAVGLELLRRSDMVRGRHPWNPQDLAISFRNAWHLSLDKPVARGDVSRAAFSTHFYWDLGRLLR